MKKTRLIQLEVPMYKANVVFCINSGGVKENDLRNTLKGSFTTHTAVSHILLEFDDIRGGESKVIKCKDNNYFVYMRDFLCAEYTNYLQARNARLMFDLASEIYKFYDIPINESTSKSFGLLIEYLTSGFLAKANN